MSPLMRSVRLPDSRLTSPRLVLAVVVVGLFGCYHWPVRSVSKIEAGQTIRVVTHSGHRSVVLNDAAVAGDSVIGRLVSADTLGESGWAPLETREGRTAIPIASITRLERRERDPQANVVLAVLVLVVGGFVLAGMLAGMGSTDLP